MLSGICLLLSGLGCVTPVLAAPVVSAGDAAIVHDEKAGTWTISAGGTSLVLGLDPHRDLETLTLTTAAGGSWIRAVRADQRPGDGEGLDVQ